MKKLLLIFFLFSNTSFGFTLNSYADPWNNGELEILVNTAGCTASILPAVKAAVDLWNSVPFSGLRLSYKESSSITAANLLSSSIVYPNQAGLACQTTSGAPFTSGSTLGVGSYQNIAGVREGAMILNSTSNGGDISNYSALFLEIVVAHEMGHMLNIGHSQLQGSLMYYNISGKTELSLHSDDMNAMAYLYPRNEFFDEGLMGCGLVQQSKTPRFPIVSFFFLFLPLVLAFLFKLKFRLKSL